MTHGSIFQIIELKLRASSFSSKGRMPHFLLRSGVYREEADRE